MRNLPARAMLAAIMFAAPTALGCDSNPSRPPVGPQPSAGTSATLPAPGTAGTTGDTPNDPTMQGALAGTGGAGTGAMTVDPSGPAGGGSTADPVAGTSSMMDDPMSMNEPPPQVEDPAAPRPSSGCNGGSIVSGHTTETLQVGSARRQYVQTVPSSYDGKQPFAVLLDFHGGTYDGPRWDARASNEFHDMAETERFIYITPTGQNQWWTTTDGKDGADGQFMTALLDELESTACIDTRRVYATGCSMGGDMSFYMACYFSDRIAAVLPLCGSASFDLDRDCNTTRPVSMTFVIGSRDTLNCWEPPRTSVGNPCATEVQAVFKELNNCQGEPTETRGGVCETFDQCDEGTEVSICMVEAQHTTIYQNPDIDIYADGWAFLKQFYIH